MAKTSVKVAKVSTKIFRQTTKEYPLRALPSSSSLKSHFGFTLIEIIVTVSIIAIIAAMALPKFNNRNNEIRATVRKIATLSRMLKQRAKLQNSTYRLVINMSEAKLNEKPIHEFWVEVAKGNVLNDYDPKNPPKLPTQEEKNDEEEKQPSLFTPDTRIIKAPLELPGELLFESVELSNLKAPVTSGLVYIHYFASGFADEAAIHLKNGPKMKWTIAVEPLTGKVDILDEFRALEDIRAK